jgi:hypothetical protein
MKAVLKVRHVRHQLAQRETVRHRRAAEALSQEAERYRPGALPDGATSAGDLALWARHEAYKQGRFTETIRDRDREEALADAAEVREQDALRALRAAERLMERRRRAAERITRVRGERLMEDAWAIRGRG